MINKTVSYQPACHLLNTQKIVEAPIELIKMIPGIKFLELPSSNICCGAGGAYSLTQPIWSKKVLDKKITVRKEFLDIFSSPRFQLIVS